MNKWHNSIMTYIQVLIYLASLLTPTSAQNFPPTPPKPIIMRETQISVFYTESQKTLVINVTQFDPEQIVKTITLIFKEPVLGISLTIFYLKEKPPEVAKPSDTPLLYFTISTHLNMLKNIEKAVLTFSVEKKTVNEKNIDEKTIILNKFSEDGWEKLSTTKIAEDEKFLHFKAESLGLYHFVVTGITIPPPFPGWIIAIVIPIIVIIGIILLQTTDNQEKT
jgi:PGF-pre-PGF domain-containing protein